MKVQVADWGWEMWGRLHVVVELFDERAGTAVVWNASIEAQWDEDEAGQVFAEQVSGRLLDCEGEEVGELLLSEDAWSQVVEVVGPAIAERKREYRLGLEVAQ